MGVEFDGELGASVSEGMASGVFLVSCRIDGCDVM